MRGATARIVRIHFCFTTVGCANDRLWSYFYLFSKGFREYLVIDFGKGNFFFFMDNKLIILYLSYK
jgi:hypothetical protein